MRLKCATHDRVFSESFDRSFHEALNVGCRWEEIRETEGGRGRVRMAFAVGTVWVALFVVLGWMLR